jgi:two-component system OmpR family response regulator
VEHIDHVLIVDDDREIREPVSGYLRKIGRRLSVADGGLQMRAPACEG